jgi:RHS repeat-associated protein
MAPRRTYRLDGRDNWLEWSGPLGTFTHGFDLVDQFLEFAGLTVEKRSDGALTKLGNETYAYNLFGEVVAASKGSESRTYRRDALGRVVEETNPVSGAKVQFGYSALSRVIERENGGAPIVHVEGDGLDEHLVRWTSTSKLFLHQDRQSSVYMVSDQAGKTVDWYRYTAYGEATVFNGNGVAQSKSASGNAFGFQGHRHDLALGLVDMRARFYRPAWGRFLSPDPTGFSDGSNRFAFVGSAPTAWMDRLGRQPAFGSSEPSREQTIGMSGVRPFAEGPRPFYRNHVAQYHAERTRYRLAEIAEANHGCTYCHIVKSYDSFAEADAAIDLEHYDYIASWMGIGAQLMAGEAIGSGLGVVGSRLTGIIGEGADDFVILNHGTSNAGKKSIIENGIDLGFSSPRNDFGRGFYVSESLEVAQQRAIQMFGDDAAVVQFRVPRSELDKLEHLRFDGPTREWQDFVRFQRQFEPDELFHGGKTYDAVSGPMWQNTPPGGFGVNGRTVNHWPWPGDSQLSFHTQRAIEMLRRFLFR